MEGYLLLTILIVPLIGIFFTFFLSVKREEEIKGFALFVSVLTLILSLSLVYFFNDNPISEEYKWIDQDIINSTFHLRVDGINIWLILLTTLLIPLGLLGSWNSITFRIKEFNILMLLLEVGIVGCLMAYDMLVFYLFWEVMLIPMYFIIGVWGSEQKIYAAVKFFIYTMIGSLFMFFAILYIYLQAGSFNFEVIYNYASIHFAEGSTEQTLLFLAFFLSFAIKVPLFPLHTWLPDAHVQAPMAGSVLLAGVLLKMGTYGFIRLAIPIFPAASVAFAPYIASLAIIGIIYGAFMCLSQTDIKSLIAYSSISHLGYVMLGLFAFTGLAGNSENGELIYQGVQGAMYQMLNHGISTGALFFLVGFLYDRRHTKEIAAFGGLAKSMPIYSAIFMITLLSSIGLPGTNGFIGEFLILLGAFRAAPVYGVLGAIGVVLGAVYMLILFQRVFYGPITKQENSLVSDLNAREIIIFIPLIALIFFMGFYSPFFLDRVDITLNQILYYPTFIK